jgi:hypothetical protein
MVLDVTRPLAGAKKPAHGQPRFPAPTTDGDARQLQATAAINAIFVVLCIFGPFPNADEISTSKISATTRCLKSQPAAIRKLQSGRQDLTV